MGFMAKVGLMSFHETTSHFVLWAHILIGALLVVQE